LQYLGLLTVSHLPIQPSFATLTFFIKGAAPKVVLEATNEKTLEVVTMECLLEHAYYMDQV